MSPDRIGRRPQARGSAPVLALLALAALAALGAATAAVLVVLAPVLAGERPPGAAAPIEARQGEELVAEGRQLYLVGCASCHGADAEGGAYGPSLVGVGAAAADYQLRTGRMPAADPTGQQERKRPAYDPEQIEALVAYVASLGEGPEIPEWEIDEALLTRGAELYIANCAPCHGATANGGATGGGWVAPALLEVEPLTVAEVIIVGPGQMPAFDFPQEDINAVVTYVEYLKRAPNPGGLEIGGIGPVPEGLVAWAVGGTALVAVTILIGREWHARRRPAARDAEPGP